MAGLEEKIPPLVQAAVIFTSLLRTGYLGTVGDERLSATPCKKDKKVETSFRHTS